MTDCDDPDCYGPSCVEICGDGVDNGGDGLLDCEDADCIDFCTESACEDGVDNDGDGDIDCLDDDCIDDASCIPDKEVFIHSAQIYRMQIGEYRDPGYGVSEWTSQATLTDIQGRVRFAPDPSRSVSTATSVTSCNFGIDTWQMDGAGDFPGFGYFSIILESEPKIYGLTLETPCSSFGTSDFLPTNTLKFPHSSQTLWGALGNQLMYRSDSSWGQRDWLSGSERQSFNRTTSPDLSYFRSNWTSVHSGEVHGVESFIWEAPKAP